MPSRKRHALARMVCPSDRSFRCPCRMDKARNNAGKWPRFERTMPTPPTIGGMPGFFENEASRPNSGDPGAKPGSELSVPATRRPSAVRTSRLSPCLSSCGHCRSAAGSRLLIPTVSRTRSRTRTHAHAKDASVPMITIGSPVDNLGSPQEREKEPKR